MDLNTSTKDTRIGTGTMIRFILVILFFVALYYLKDLVFVILAAVVIASAIEPASNWFKNKLKVPRLPAVIIIYLLAFFIIIGLTYSFLPLLINETLDVVSRAPELIESVSSFGSSGNGVGSGILENITNTISVSEILSQLGDLVSNLSGNILSLLSKIFGGAMSFMLIVVISFYLSVQKGGIEEFLRIVTPVKHEKYIVDLWKRSQRKIGRWMQGQIILGLIVGVLVYLGLVILGVKNALLLAILAAVFELIPLFGPILAGIPAISIAFIDGGITLALMVIGLYTIIQQFENHLIYPLVVKKVVGVPALVVIISLLIGAQLAGFIGIILSVPIASAIMEYANDVESKKRKLLEEMNYEPRQ